MYIKVKFVIVTSRQTKLREITIKWLNSYYPEIFSDLRLGNHYGEKGAKKSKLELCQELGLSNSPNNPNNPDNPDNPSGE